jgi:hypothetical protein
MRRRFAGGVAAVLWVGLAVSAAGAGDGGDLHSLPPPKEGSSWLPLWMGGRRDRPEPMKPQAPEKADKPDKDKADKAAAPAPRPQPNDPAAVQARELNAYWRRMEVCDRLMEYAVDTNNEELQRQADELQQRTFAVYQRRTLHAGGSPKLDADEAALDQRLGEDRAARAEEALEQPAKPVNGGRRTARVWEGKP